MSKIKITPITHEHDFAEYIEVAIKVIQDQVITYGTPGLGVRRADLVEEVDGGLRRVMNVRVRHKADSDAYWKLAEGVTDTGIAALRKGKKYQYEVDGQTFPWLWAIREKGVMHYYRCEDLTREQLDAPREERRQQRTADAKAMAKLEAQIDWLDHEMEQQGVSRVGDLRY